MYLTYDETQNQDGLGAQYQRVVGIVALAEMMGAKYVHTPPVIAGGGLHGYKDDEGKLLERFLGITGCEYPNDVEVVKLANPVLDDFTALRDRNALVKVHLPYKIVEQDGCSALMRVIPKLRKLVQHPPCVFDSNGENVAIHIRLGDVVGNPEHAFRFISIEAYRSLLTKLKTEKVKIHIFSEDNALLDEIRGMDVELHLGKDLSYTLSHLMKADRLYISKSSFSYLAGLYNPNQVFYAPFWHQAPSHWKTWFDEPKTAETRAPKGSLAGRLLESAARRFSRQA